MTPPSDLIFKLSNSVVLILPSMELQLIIKKENLRQILEGWSCHDMVYVINTEIKIYYSYIFHYYMHITFVKIYNYIETQNISLCKGEIWCMYFLLIILKICLSVIVKELFNS